MNKQMSEFNPQMPAASSPFDNENLSHGTVAIESTRATAEAAGQIRLAKMFPRSLQQVRQEVIESCRDQGLASAAIYSVPKGGQTATGPSIRLAEELARIMGNIKYGIMEMSRSEGKSEMKAFAWDMEKNTISEQNFTVEHVRDLRSGQRKLKSQQDIYEATANMGSKRKRGCILSVIPPSILELAIGECQKTMQGNNEVPLADRVSGMISAFDKVGVSRQMLEVRLGKPVDQMTSAELGEYRGIFNSLKDKHSDVTQWFSKPEEAAPALTGGSFDPAAPKQREQVRQESTKQENNGLGEI